MPTAAASDPAATLTIITLLAGTFVAVGLYLLFKLTDGLAHLVLVRTKRRLSRSRHFLKVPRIGRLLWAIDVGCVVGLRGYVCLYVGVVLLLLTPIFLTVESFNLAAALISSP